MRLIELELTNFKGIRSFSIYLNGSNARVFGDNATGKTTLMDAFVWVLTGKDHLGRSDLNFDIKTLENGTVIPMIEHTVLARIEHEGCQVELIRTFKEVWQKKTGTNVETFTGHKTEYLIDGVPKSEKDYSAFIERLVPTNLLKLLLSPAYFNEQLKAEERRKLLLEMCGDLDESEMLSMPEWAELAANITKFVSVADLKKSMTAQKTKINDDLKSIPVAINVHTQYLNVSGVNSRSERLALNELQPKIDELERDIAGIRNGETLSKARRELADLKAAYSKAEVEAVRKSEDETRGLRSQIRNFQDLISNFQRDKTYAQRDLDRLKSDIDDLNKKREKALEAYYANEDREFTAETVCPTCGQEYPAEHIDHVREQFNETKAQKADEIVKEGKHLAVEIAKKETEATTVSSRIAAIQQDIQSAEETMQSLTAALNNQPETKVDFDKSLIAAKEAEISSLSDSTLVKTTELINKLNALKDEKAAHEKNLGRLQNAENAQKEIDALKTKEKNLAAAYEQCEAVIAMCDAFTNARVKMLDERISGFFRVARFKLTETLVNGGLREICDTLIDGVPYSAANNAARINIGLDIIQTFSQHYGVSLPVFVDNAESVTALENISTQVIQLIVSEPDKTLRVEVL